MAVVVRRLRPDEGPLLRALRLAALADAPGAFASTWAAERASTDDDWADRARLGATGSDRATFVAVVDEQPAGLVGGSRSGDGRVVELVSLWTDPAVRRSGTARALVAAVLAWAAEVGAAEVQLWVTRGNEPAARLYADLGFTETGEHQPLPSDPCREERRLRRGPPLSSCAGGPPRTTR